MFILVILLNLISSPVDGADNLSDAFECLSDTHVSGGERIYIISTFVYVFFFLILVSRSYFMF